MKPYTDSVQQLRALFAQEKANQLKDKVETLKGEQDNLDDLLAFTLEPKK